MISPRVRSQTNLRFQVSLANISEAGVVQIKIGHAVVNQLDGLAAVLESLSRKFKRRSIPDHRFPTASREPVAIHEKLNQHFLLKHVIIDDRDSFGVETASRGFGQKRIA